MMGLQSPVRSGVQLWVWWIELETQGRKASRFSYPRTTGKDLCREDSSLLRNPPKLFFRVSVSSGGKKKNMDWTLCAHSQTLYEAHLRKISPKNPNKKKNITNRYISLRKLDKMARTIPKPSFPYKSKTWSSRTIYPPRKWTNVPKKRNYCILLGKLV